MKDNNNNVTLEKKKNKDEKWCSSSAAQNGTTQSQTDVATEASCDDHVEEEEKQHSPLAAEAEAESSSSEAVAAATAFPIPNSENNNHHLLHAAAANEEERRNRNMASNMHSRPFGRPKSPWQQPQPQPQQQQQQQTESERYDDEEEDSCIPSLCSKCMEYAFLISWHIVCLSVYIIPIVLIPLPNEYASPNYNPPLTLSVYTYGSSSSPVLDELHIMSANNHDIHGHLHDDSTWQQVLHQIFTNDYWGRPMNSLSSHKSWRPLTVLSFRWFKHFIAGHTSKNHNFELLGHRLVNIVTHAAIAELVAILAIKLVIPTILNTSTSTTTTTMTKRQQQQQQKGYYYYDIRNRQRLLLHSITKLIFVLHPTHVEVVANAANRPHLFAILFALILCDPDISILFYIMSLICGFLSAETFIFTIPATLVTRCVILYQRQYHYYYYYNQSAIPAAQVQQEQTQKQSQPTELLLANGMQQHHRDDFQQQQSSNGSSSNDNCGQQGTHDQKPTPSPSKIAESIPPPPPTLPLTLLPIPPPPPLYHQLLQIIHETRFQCLLSIMACITYMYMRYQLDWLSIPDGLIRPAENPFFNLRGRQRIVSYAYIFTIHVLKSWDLDIIGFSHEYGHACILPLDSIFDQRFLYCIGVSVVLLTIGIYLIVTTFLQRRRLQSQQSHHQQPPQIILSTGCILYLVHLSWMLTLFPISGIVKVGTFVADRIVVPSTISFSIVVAYILTFWLTLDHCNKSHHYYVSLSSFHIPHSFKWILLIGLMVPLSWHRIHVRTLQWMDSLPLLQSSLQTCPNSAKSHLEISKIYSGMYPELYNLDIAHMHLMRVQEIDVNYCDVHQQLAHVAIQRKPPSQRHVLEFEQELLQALLCPYTMGGAMNLWKQYWDQTLNNHITQTNAAAAQRQAAVQDRYNGYVHTINAAIAKADREEQERERAEAAAAASSLTKSSLSNKSPFVWGSSK